MITVQEIARIVGGTVKGDGSVRVTGLATVGFAGESDIIFAFNEKDMEEAARSRAACVITVFEKPGFSKTSIKVKDIKAAATILYNVMLDKGIFKEGGIHPTAVIEKTAILGNNNAIGAGAFVGKRVKTGDNVIIGANCTIGNDVSIGSGTRLCANVVIYDRVVIGKSVILHSGVVIGADGFGYIPGQNGKMLKVPQLGGAIIEDNVEIGANACIDRGTFSDTVIGKGTKIDNLVQVAHNIRIGKNVLIAGQTGLAGSVTIGDGAMLGGQVGVADHVNIGPGMRIAAKAGVVKDTDTKSSSLFGYPARDAKEAMKQIAFLNWLYKNAKKLRGLLGKDGGEEK